MAQIFCEKKLFIISKEKHSTQFYNQLQVINLISSFSQGHIHIAIV